MTSYFSPIDPLLCPVPVGVVTYSDPEGRGRFWPVTWLGVTCASPAALKVALAHCSGEFPASIGSVDFAVNLFPEGLLTDEAFLAELRRLEGDLAGLRDLSLKTSPPTFPLERCPVVLECAAAGLERCHGRFTLRGEIRAFYQDAVRYGPEAHVALWSLLRPRRTVQAGD